MCLPALAGLAASWVRVAEKSVVLGSCAVHRKLAVRVCLCAYPVLVLCAGRWRDCVRNLKVTHGYVCLFVCILWYRE